MSVLSTVAPAAFAQNSVTANQSNSFTANVAQGQTSTGGSGDTEQEQGFCLFTNQQNAAAGDDATNQGANSFFADRGGEIDCS